MNKNSIATDSNGYKKSLSHLLNIRTEQDRRAAIKMINLIPLGQWSFVDIQASTRATRFGLCAHINIMIKDSAARQGYLIEEIKPYIKSKYCVDAVRDVDEKYNSFCESKEDELGIPLTGIDEQSDSFKAKMAVLVDNPRISFSPYGKATQKTLKACRENVERYYNYIMQTVAD